jgi:cytochrome b involved in lipid metabolism
MRARVPTPRESKTSGAKEEVDVKHLPRPYKLRRFYTPAEVAKHNTADDVWVSKFNKVFDLTLLLDANKGKTECDPIVLAAGTDITHWFDPDNEGVSMLSPMCTLIKTERGLCESIC